MKTISIGYSNEGFTCELHASYAESLEVSAKEIRDLAVKILDDRTGYGLLNDIVERGIEDQTTSIPLKGSQVEIEYVSFTVDSDPPDTGWDSSNTDIDLYIHDPKIAYTDCQEPFTGE